MAAVIGTELDVSTLAAQVRGEVIQPGDAAYEEARKVYNAMIDKRPALIVRCVDVADVIAGVNFARENGILLAVRCGGHNGAGLGTCDDGIVLDLSPMKGIRVDPVARLATVQGGCTWGDVDHATHAFGLATPSGIISTTGMGLTLGGGIGNLTRKHGLSVDNIVSADVVLADGSLVTADEGQNEDLFWAIRGGGGNFGIVTSLTLRLHPVSTVFWGPMLWPLERSAEILRAYDGWIADAPDDFTGFFAFLTVPPGPPFPEDLHLKKMCGVVWCHTGSAEEAEAALAPARATSPALDLVGPVPHPAAQSAFDAVYPPGDQWYWRADFVKEIPDEAIAKNVEFAEKLPTWKSTVHLYPIDGAAGRIADNATAFNYRGARWAQVMVGVDPDPANAETLKAWTIAYWEALHPFSLGGAYVNFMMDEGQERVQATYGGNYQRLTEIKRRYDPGNLFRVNQNIRPA